MPCPKILIGADPELFVRNKSTGQFVSAHDLIPGTKEKPFPVDLGAIQVDGVAAEFNIDPSGSSKEFLRNIQAVMGQLQTRLGSDYELVSDPTVTFDPIYFSSLPNDVRILGCNPDYNAWSGEVTAPPDGSKTTMRTGAGHIHIGFCKDADPTDPTHIEDCRIVAKQLDYFLGLQSLKWDSDDKRRTLYGKAGCFRPKPYGVEYRSLSNKWLESSLLQDWIWRCTFQAVYNLFEGQGRPEDVYGDLARDIIDNSIRWWDDKTYKSKFKTLTSLTQMNDPPVIIPPKIVPTKKKASAHHVYSKNDSI